MMLNRRDIAFGFVVVAVLVTGAAIAAYSRGVQAGWATPEPVVEIVKVPVIQAVEVEKCVVPCIEPCAEPAEPCEEAPEVSTAVPKPTPTPTLVVPVCPTEFGDHELGKQEIWQVPACWTCLGDLAVEGILYYDLGVAETGLVIYFAESAEVYAGWGANCISGDRRSQKEAEALESGCGLKTGCEKVHVYVWPEDPPK